jgi:hypothetical protein
MAEKPPVCSDQVIDRFFTFAVIASIERVEVESGL